MTKNEKVDKDKILLINMTAIKDNETEAEFLQENSTKTIDEIFCDCYQDNSEVLLMMKETGTWTCMKRFLWV